MSFDLGEMMQSSSSCETISVCLSEVGINSILDIKYFTYKLLLDKGDVGEFKKFEELERKLEEVFPELIR